MSIYLTEFTHDTGAGPAVALERVAVGSWVERMVPAAELFSFSVHYI
jgi:hypothetical protein